MKTSIIINFSIEGVHSWPSCPLAEVQFLKNEHRHLFYIRCEKAVDHSDRAIEIIKFKREVQEYLWKKYGFHCCYFGALSCEMIAEELVKQFNLSRCSVLEDNENGAIVSV